MDNNVLFVDDEIHILKAIKRGLRDESFNKFYATSGKDAIDILKSEDIHCYRYENA
jgi:DNA-binding response OmpR family regulator